MGVNSILEYALNYLRSNSEFVCVLSINRLLTFVDNFEKLYDFILYLLCEEIMVLTIATQIIHKTQNTNNEKI